MQFVVGDAVETVWGSGRVQDIRSEDEMFVVQLDNWKLAQGQSPTLFLGRDAMKKQSDENGEEEDDDNLPIPSLMRHITIEEDSLPPLPLMIRLASHNAEKEKMSCCICDELVLHGVGHLRLGCRCLCHETCFVAYIRSKSRDDWGRAGGIACPYALGAEMCNFKGQNNEPYRITPNDLGQMVKLLGCADRLSSTAEEYITDSLITLDEIEKFETWILEFRQEGKTLMDGSGNDTIFTANDNATRTFINATTKACPICSLRATHYHGHSCHHIYGGCEGCNEEYCYRCLSTATQNLKERNDRTCCPCGSWETFCNNEDLCFFLVCKPYPHDSRCGCTICPDCRPSNPCDMCDGSCVVCDGLIAPAPLDLEALDDWKHNCTADELDPGSIYISGAMSFDVNGVYVPGDEEDIDDEYYDDEGECTNMPVYIKKQYEDDDGVCISLKCVERDDGYCWRIKRGDSKTAVAYVMISMDNVCLPQADMDHSWFVNINGDFQERSQVTARLVQPEVPLPDEFIQKFEKGKETVLDGHSRYLAELLREPYAGSVTVSGLPHEKANGVYEPTSVISNDMPVYRLRGAKTFSLEFIKDSLGCSWRVIEIDKVSLAMQVFGPHDDAKNGKYSLISQVCLPHETEIGDDNVKDGDGEEHIRKNKTITWLVFVDGCYSAPEVPVAVTLSNPTEPIPTTILEAQCVAQLSVEELIKEKVAEDMRAPIQGSLVITSSQNIGDTISPHVLRYTGTFEPTETLTNGYPIYVKKGDPNVRLENSNSYRWNIKAPVVHRESSALNIIAECSLKNDALLPTQCSTEDWKFADGAYILAMREELTVSPTLAKADFLPDNILNLLSLDIKSKLRPPLPGSVVVKGATGSRGNRVNGIFEPTDEVYNDMPVYRKKGDSGTWLELVTGNTGNLRWYVKPTANRGSSSVCFGYLDQEKKNLLLPHDCGAMQWHVYDGSAFTIQKDVTSSLVDPETPIPEAMIVMLEAKREAFAIAIAEKEALMAIPPIPGSFSLEGATGSRAYGVNGIFEPTSETYNDMPCYKKKGEEVWAEMVHGASGYRWYIKPTANRGSSSVCFAYCKFDEENPTLPFDREKDKWLVYNGKEFATQDTVVTKLVPEGVPVPEDQLRMLAACKVAMEEKAAKKREEVNLICCVGC
mmetsp:Transcript_4392/g.8155  ORF Transcript_4392/g.8155 Transcript_4392/m.8155 type:complete len:1152 (-) Transcript_4392:2470-5925(-)